MKSAQPLSNVTAKQNSKKTFGSVTVAVAEEHV
jgi:hypothetical protein